MTDREKLIELLHKGVRCPGTVATCEVDCPYWSEENPCDEFAATADMLIANGVVVREKGEFELVEFQSSPLDTDQALVCSCCGFAHQYDAWFNFCPNCGADMRKGC